MHRPFEKAELLGFFAKLLAQNLIHIHSYSSPNLTFVELVYVFFNTPLVYSVSLDLSKIPFLSKKKVFKSLINGASLRKHSFFHSLKIAFIIL